MDIVADDLGLDPVEVRMKNFPQPSEFPYKTAAEDKNHDLALLWAGVQILCALAGGTTLAQITALLNQLLGLFGSL